MKNCVLILLLCLGNVFGQAQGDYSFIQLKEHSFQYGDQVGKLHEFATVFQHDAEQYQHFTKFNKARKTQKVLNYTSIGIFTLGMIGAATIEDNSSEHNYAALYSAGFGLLGGSAFAIFGNLIAGATKATHRKRLFDSVRSGGLSQVKLQSSVNGIGLSYTF